MDNNVCNFSIKEYPMAIYSVSNEAWMKRESEGGAIMQTWVIQGSEKILAIDSPVPAADGFRDFLECFFQLPCIMVNSHGHIDHTGCNSQFQDIWLSKEDWSLLAGGGIFRTEDADAMKDIPYRLHDIKEGQKFELGNRTVLSYAVPGHTKGSFVFYDERSKGLFSGDAVARRILYGMSDSVPLDLYMRSLEKLKALRIDGVYSMHDDFVLPGDMPARILGNIKKHLKDTTLVWKSPVDGRIFKHILLGKNEEDENYFDFVIPKDNSYDHV